jgi:hypothetical protein
MLLKRIEPHAPNTLKLLDPTPNLFQGLGMQMINSLPSIPPFRNQIGFPKNF